MSITNLRISNREHALGNLWWIFEPLIWMLIYWLFVGVILNRGEANYPFFILCGLIPFRSFSQSINQSIKSILSRYSLLLQTPIPKIFIPISFVISNHIKLGFGLLILIGFSLVTYGTPNIYALLLPIAIFFQFIICCGLSLFLSVLGIVFKDLATIMQFVTRALIFFSPILYTIDRVPEKLRTIFMLNPIAILVSFYRAILMHETTNFYMLITSGLLESLIILFLGLIFFNKMQNEIMKRI